MRTNAPEDNHVDEGAPALLGSLVDVRPAAVSSKSSCSSVSCDEEYELAFGERSNFKKIPTHTQDHGDA